MYIYTSVQLKYNEENERLIIQNEINKTIFYKCVHEGSSKFILQKIWWFYNFKLNYITVL